MGRAVAAQGLAHTTIADVVREAGMSKRSFYEHFPNKEACFLALYAAASGAALRTLKEAVQPDRPWQDQLEAALDAYFTHLASGHQLLKALFVDIHLLGPSGAEVRREVLEALAQFMCDTVNGHRRTGFGPAHFTRPGFGRHRRASTNGSCAASSVTKQRSLPQMAPTGLYAGAFTGPGHRALKHGLDQRFLIKPTTNSRMTAPITEAMKPTGCPGPYRPSAAPP